MKQVTTENINDYIDYIMDDYVDWCGQAQIGSASGATKDL